MPFHRLARQGRPNHHAFVSEPAWFYFPRFGKEDRRHGVPNPLAHLLLSRAVADNYVDLRRKARASKITLSPPVLDWSGSRASITQQFNTTTSMGRLTLNVLLSFAQFERELIGERVRDKIAASRKKGMWMGGTVPLKESSNSLPLW
jgi:Resolvase, N terminal domain